MIDPEGTGCDIGVDLQDNESATHDESRPRPRGRRKWLRRLALALLVLLAVFAGGLVWLNGPGLRWLAPKVAAGFLEKAGMRGNFVLEGSLTGGISVKDLQLASDKALERLAVGRITPSYRFRELAQGRLDGIVIDGLHADLRLGLESEKPEDKDKPPFDLEKLVQTLRSVRGRVIPGSIDLRNISVKATKDGKPVIALAPSRIHHAAGEPELKVELGAITDANGREWPAQQSAIVWNAEDLTIDRIDPLPGVSIRDLAVKLPASGGPSAETEVRVDDAVFMVGASPGFTSARIDLREGKLPQRTGGGALRPETSRAGGAHLPVGECGRTAARSEGGDRGRQVAVR